MHLGIAADHGGFLREGTHNADPQSCWADTYSARQGMEDDDMNIICLGGVTGSALALELIEAFLAARFLRRERFLRRPGKIDALERGEKTGKVPQG